MCCVGVKLTGDMTEGDVLTLSRLADALRMIDYAGDLRKNNTVFAAYTRAILTIPGRNLI